MPGKVDALVEVGEKTGSRTAKGLSEQSLKQELNLGESSEFKNKIDTLMGGQAALQAQAQKNGWSTSDEYEYQHGLVKERSEKFNLDINEHYDQQIGALKAQQEQSQKALKQVTSKTPGSKEYDSEAATEMEVTKEKDAEEQKAEVNKAKEIQGVKNRFDNLKSQLKQKYEDNVREAQSDPPKYKLFSGNGLFLIIAGVDFVASVVPGLAIILSPILFVASIILWAIPCILLRSPLSIIPIIIFYAVDYTTSMFGSIIPYPVVGAVIDLLPELVAWKMMRVAPNQIIAAAEEKFTEKKIHSLEDKFRAAMHDLDERYQRGVKRINSIYNKARFMMPSFDLNSFAQQMNLGLLLLLAGILTWFKIIGISFDVINITQLMLTGIFLIIAFFIGKMGLIKLE